MTQKKSELDEMFTAYASTAPLEDLRFYIRGAVNRLAEFELSERTNNIIAEMTTLEQQIWDIPGTPAMKRRVWALIDRYKTSIPGWAGSAGARGSWVDPIDSDSLYWRVQAETIKDDDTLRAEGPVSLEQITAWHTTASARADALHNRVPRRAVALTPEQVQVLIQSAQPTSDRPSEQKTARTRHAGVSPVPIMNCPSCRATLLPVALCANTWGCANCKETWHLQAVRQPVQQTRPVVTPRIRTAIVTTDGTRICRTCATEQPINQFTYGDGGRTIRNLCLSCRKVQQREATARRKHAA